MSKTTKIALPHGGIIPASVLAKKSTEDKKVGPHEPVEVDATYAESLINDRFAYAYDPKTAPKRPEDPVVAAQGMLAAAEKKAGEITAAAENKAKELVADAEKKAGEVAAEAEEKANKTIAEAEKLADETKAAAEDRAKEIIAAAEQTANPQGEGSSGEDKKD